jgi:hypothetical protein
VVIPFALQGNDNIGFKVLIGHELTVDIVKKQYKMKYRVCNNKEYKKNKCEIFVSDPGDSLCNFLHRDSDLNGFEILLLALKFG